MKSNKVTLKEGTRYYKNNNSVLYISPERLRKNLSQFNSINSEEIEKLIDTIKSPEPIDLRKRK